MKFIITEEQERISKVNLRLYKIYELAKPYFEEKGYNNLEKVDTEDIVYYIDKNRNIIFYYKQDRKDEIVYISHSEVWAVFESYFSLQYTEIQEVMRLWLEEFYRISGLTPRIPHFQHNRRLDEVYRISGLTPTCIGRR